MTAPNEILGRRHGITFSRRKCYVIPHNTFEVTRAVANKFWLWYMYVMLCVKTII